MRKKFVAVRYFMVPLEQSLFYKPMSNDEKRDLFIKAFLKNQNYESSKGARIGIRGIYSEGDLYYGKLGKYTKIVMDQDTQTDFEPQEKDGFFTVKFVCDTINQILVMEMNGDFESDLSRICKWLEAIANRTTLEYEYNVSFRAIVPKGDFWQLVENSAKIFSVDLILESPNLFGGKNNAQQSLKDWQAIYNQNSLSVKLRNKKGNLLIPRDEISSYVDYADQGGGHWIISILDKITKRKKRVNSAQIAAATFIEIDEVSEETLYNALKDLEVFNEYPISKD